MNRFDGVHVTANGEQEKRVKPKNLFVAHNGYKFDYRFLYETLYQTVGDFQMIGSINATKAIEGHGLQFIDTALIIPGTLASIAKSFFPGDASRQKFENETIKGLEVQQFHELTPE